MIAESENEGTLNTQGTQPQKPNVIYNEDSGGYYTIPKKSNSKKNKDKKQSRN
jgi:hypothetical protein